MVDFIEVMRRTENGPYMTERDFDIEIVFKTARELSKKYGIAYDRKQLITLTPELADVAFQAGLELAEKAGIYCVTTSRVIKFTREELLRLKSCTARVKYRLGQRPKGACAPPNGVYGVVLSFGEVSPGRL